MQQSRASALGRPDAGFLGALVLPTAITNAGFARSTVGIAVGVRFVVLMALWAVGAVTVGVALVLGLDAGAALAMPGAGDDVGVRLAVFMALWAVGDVGFPASAISLFVLVVIVGSSPVEIAQLIVVGVIIAMAALVFRGPRTHKGFQHESVNRYLLGDPVTPQGDRSVVPLIRTSGPDLLQNAARPHPRSPSAANLAVQRPHVALVGDLVAGIIGDRNPSFIITHRFNSSMLKGLQCR